MSELFMECEEEELEPWQIQVPKNNLVDDNDDDDEPIFVGELSSSKSTSNFRLATNNQKNVKTTPVQTGTVGHLESSRMTSRQTSNISSLTTQCTLGPQSTIIPGNGSLSSVSPQPIIINNQGYIVSSPQMMGNNSTFITSLGKQYPPGTSFTIVPAGQQHFMQQVIPSNSTPGVIHRPQVQQISNNVVTLSNVQTPVAFSPAQAARQLTQPVQIVSGPIKALSPNKDNNSLKRSLPADNESTVKKNKIDAMGSVSVVDSNVIFKKACPKCKEMFFQQDILKLHMQSCCPNFVERSFPFPCQASSKRIMLVKDFYYGRHEGDKKKQMGAKTNTTFKCQSCLKVLKNNVRFMNHMKHHLELEKQNSESWESHTTCQHCYRQYTTPFQLQCHIESAHSPYESSTNCKICELAFESEQVLLEHMKDNHKPGEMPYLCQVCDYRSSFFSEVETHFRSVHDNTKDLLCPFCLKVLRSGHVYMQHYMKHQRKGIHRCGKCRLNFLTYKERVDHKLHFHKTFRKPTALEGLPAGTKVTVRASLTGPTPTSPGTPSKSIVNIVPDVQATKHAKSQGKSVKQKEKSTKKQERQPKKSNKVLKNLEICDEKHICIECETVIDNFFSHYPSVVTCGACKYQTSCKVSVGNHMIRFHSNVSKDKIKRMDRRKVPTISKRLTLVCLNCDTLVDASESDRMSKHLIDLPHHACKVIEDRTPHGSRLLSHPDKLKGLAMSVEPSVLCISSAVGGTMVHEARPVENLKSEDDVILIDDDTAARHTSEESLPTVNLTQDVTVKASVEDSVGNELMRDQSLQPDPTSPSHPLTCESDGSVVLLDKSSSSLNSMSSDIGEQVLPLLEPQVPSVRMEHDVMVIPAEESPLITDSPAADLVLIPDSNGISSSTENQQESDALM